MAEVIDQGVGEAGEERYTLVSGFVAYEWRSA